MRASLIFTTVALAIISSCTNQPSEKSSGDSVDLVSGIDLSHHNRVEDWSKLDVNFIYLKATEGTGWVDPEFRHNCSQARQHGIPVGAYHFMTTASPAEEQFESFKAAVPKDRIDLIPVLDIERQSKGHALSKKCLQQHVLEWCRLCKQHYGSYPIIYSSLGFYQNNFNGVLDHMMFWCGDVDAAQAYVNQKEWAIWQQRIEHVDGAIGKIDMNILNSNLKLSDIMLKK